MTEPSARITLLQRFRDWRRERLIRRVVYASADYMLSEAAKRAKSATLTDDEQRALVKEYALWLMADNQRLLATIDDERPTRIVHLFLSQEL